MMKAEPQPTNDVNRASGTDSDNGCWLRRLVRGHGLAFDKDNYICCTATTSCDPKNEDKEETHPYLAGKCTCHKNAFWTPDESKILYLLCAHNRLKSCGVLRPHHATDPQPTEACETSERKENMKLESIQTNLRIIT